MATTTPWPAAPRAGPAPARRGRPLPAARDCLAALAVGVASVVALGLSDEPGTRPPDLAAHLLLVMAAAPLAWWRRRPAVVLAAVLAVALPGFALGYPGGPLTLPLLAAIYAAAASGHRRSAWLAAGLLAVVGSAFRTFVEGEAAVSVAFNAALFVLVALLGDAVDSRRRLRRETAERLRRAEADREREARQRVAEERVRIARELHDVLAHTITTMTVQAGVAADTIDDRPEQARAALRAIRGSARHAMAELRATVAVLRDSGKGSPRLPAPGLDRLPELVDAARKDGLEVELRATGTPGPLADATGLTGYRIVQEALTNVVRHAGAASATVTVEYGTDAVVVTVDDDGRGGPAGAPGFGIRGMRERARALGGRLEAGPLPGRGFRVVAHLPACGSPA